MEALPGYSGAGREKWVLQLHSAQVGKPSTPSLLSFPCQLVQPCAVWPWGKDSTDQVPITLTSVSWLLLFSFSDMLESPLRKAGFLQILSYSWASAQVSTLQVFPDHSQEGLERHCWLLLVSQPGLGSVYLLLDTQAGEPLPRSFGLYCSCRSTFLHGWMPS